MRMANETSSRPELAGLVAAVLKLGGAEVTDADELATLPGWSSRKHLELVVRLEETYQVSLSAQEAFTVCSVGELRALLRGQGVSC
jgi:acyl carrier protein